MKNMNYSQLYRSTIGFEQIADLFDNAFHTDAATFPAYNIVKAGEASWEIVLATAGFSRDEISIKTQGGDLIIAGQKSGQDREDITYVYEGVPSRSFERNFKMIEYMEVVGASYKDGLLTVKLERKLPEALKPRSIEIN